MLYNYKITFLYKDNKISLLKAKIERLKIEKTLRKAIYEFNTQRGNLIHYLFNIQLTTFNKAHPNKSKIFYELPIKKTNVKNLILEAKNIFLKDF